MSVSNRARLLRLRRERGSTTLAARTLRVSASTVRKWLKSGVPDAIKTKLAQKTKRYYPQHTPKPKPKPKAKPRPKQAPVPATPKKISAKDQFILKSLERNHLAPKVRKKYLAELSPNARKVALAKHAKPTKPRAKPKPKKLTEQDLFILNSWDDLSEEAQQKYFKKLSAPGKRRIQKRERDRLKEQERKEQALAEAERERRKIPAPQRLREDLNQAINEDAWTAIRGEVRFDKDRTQAVVVQRPDEVVKAAEELAVIRPDIRAAAPNANRFYTIIAAVTQYPPEAHYGQRALQTKQPLTIFYFTAETVKKEEDLASAIASAIEGIRAQMPGDAPIGIVGIHIRTKQVIEKG